MSIRHTKVSTKPDGSDTSLIQPSDWNADHSVDWGGPPADVEATGQAGASTQVARADHVHGHGTGYLPDAHHPRLHAGDHVSGGPDPLSGSLDATARVHLMTNGVSVASRRALNLIAGSNVSLSASDNEAAERVDVTVAASGAASGSESWAAVVRRSGSTFTARRADGSTISSGADPVAVVNAAISDVSASGGGAVFVAASCGQMAVGATPITLATGVRLICESAWGRAGDAVNPTLAGARFVATTGATSVIRVPSSASAIEVEGAAVDGAGIASIGIQSQAFDARIVAPCVIRCGTGVQLSTSLAQTLVGPWEIRDCTTGIAIAATDCIVAGPGRLLKFTTGIDITAGGTQVRGIHATSGVTAAVGARIQAQFPVLIEDVIFDSVKRPIQLDGSYGELLLSHCSFYPGSTAEPAAIYANAPGRMIIEGLRVFDAGASWTNLVRFAGVVGKLVMRGVLVDSGAITGPYVTDGTDDLSDVYEPWLGFVTSGIAVM